MLIQRHDHLMASRGAQRGKQFGGDAGGTERGLTPAQQRTLDSIRRYVRENGIPPSIRDLCRMMKLQSTSSVQLHMVNLQRAGAIAMRAHVPRSVRVLWPLHDLIEAAED